MIIKNLKAEGFRNIKNAEFSFSESCNIIGGNNAQGKTNLMEAIACAVERSFRTNHAAELLPQDEKGNCRITLDFTVDAHSDKLNTLVCNIGQNGIDRKINGISYKEAVKLYPQLKTVVFVPEDLYIIKGNPDARRELADETADMMNKMHRNVTANYMRALKQKNTFLGNLTQGHFTRSDAIEITVWNEGLAKAGVNVMVGRLKYFSALSKYASEYYSQLNNNNEVLTAVYQSSIMEDTPFAVSDVELMFDTYRQKLKDGMQREMQAGHTLIGAHRDDIAFYINGRLAKDYASQGQVRSIAIALRLAQARMFTEKWKEAPVMILDDVLSELDEHRRDFILKHIVDSQVFITGCNSLDFTDKAGKRWTACNGEFTSEEG